MKHKFKRGLSLLLSCALILTLLPATALAAISPIPTEGETDPRYTVEFYAGNGMTGTPYETQIVQAGETLVRPETPEILEGYNEFAGWYIGGEKDKNTGVYENGTEVQFGQVSETWLEENATDNVIQAHARFINAIHVTFYDCRPNTKTDGDGNTVEPAIVTTRSMTGGPIDLNSVTAEPWEAGMVFDEWVDQNGNTVSTPYAADEDTSLYATFTQGYSLVFDANGDGATNTATQYLKEGENTTTPATPARPGYTFQGWYTAATNGDQFAFGNTLSADTTVYAHWTAATANYTVVFWYENADDNRYSYAGSTTGSTSTGSTISSSLFQSTDFTGRDNIHFTYNNAEAESQVVAGDGSTVLNVYFTRNTYTLTFKSQNQSGGGHSGGNNNQATYGTITAKYQAYIGDQWPTAGTTMAGSNTRVPDNLTGWSVTLVGNSQSTTQATKVYTMTEQYCSNSGLTLTANTSNNANTYTANYMMESLNRTGTQYNGKYYQNDSRYSQSLYTTMDTLSPKQIDGFTAVLNSSVKVSNSAFTLYYNRNRNTITFNDNYGNTTATISDVMFEMPLSDVTYDGKAISEIVPTYPNEALAEHYTFKGWYTTEGCYDGTEADFTNGTMPNANLIFYAKWEAEKIDVIYDANGGTFSSGAPTSVQVDYGTKLTNVPTPYNEGYTFLGWVDENGNAWNFDSTITEDVTLYAQWHTDHVLNIVYSVTTVDEDGNETTSLNQVTDPNHYDDGAIAIVKPFGTSGKRFVGWSLGEFEGNYTTLYQPGDEIEVSSATDRDDGSADYTITLYAVYDELPTASIVFNANGGAFSDEQETKTKSFANNADVDLDTIETPTKEGYKFLGWATDESATTPTYTANSAETAEIYVTKNTDGSNNVLYAVWKEVKAPKITYATKTGSIQQDATGTKEAVQAGDEIYYTISFTSQAQYFSVEDSKLPDNVNNIAVQKDNEPITNDENNTPLTLASTTHTLTIDLGSVPDDDVTITVNYTYTVTADDMKEENVVNTATIKAWNDENNPSESKTDDDTIPIDKYDINSIEKELVTSENIPNSINYTFPETDADGKVVVPSTGVTLLYKITVKGDVGADYTVSDNGAQAVPGYNLTGTLGETGEAVIYVTREFTASDITDGKLTNVATVQPGDNSEIPEDKDDSNDEDDPYIESDPVETPAKTVEVTVTKAPVTANSVTGVTAAYTPVTETTKDGVTTYSITAPADAAITQITLLYAVTVNSNGQTTATVQLTDNGALYAGNDATTGGNYTVSADSNNSSKATVTFTAAAIATVYFAKTITLPVTAEITNSVSYTVDNGEGKSEGSDPVTVYYTITATAGEGGSIAPSGNVTVAAGENQTFTITPNSGYKIDTVTVDGEAASVTDRSYTFNNVQKNHTIHVTFTQLVTQVDVKKELTSVGDETDFTNGVPMAKVGETITWTITVENKGETDLTGLTLTDSISGVELSNDQNLTPDSFDLDSGSTVTFTATYKVAQSDVGKELKNSVTVKDGNDPIGDGESDKDVTVEGKGLTVTKTANQTKAEVGDTITWTITVKNTGNVTLNNIIVTDELDGAVIKAGTGYTINDNGNAVIASLNSGETVEVTVSYTVQDDDTGKTISNTAVAKADDSTEGTDTNDDVEIPVPTDPEQPGLSVNKTLTQVNGWRYTKGSVEVGDLLTYAITVTNTGNVDLTGVTVIDQLPYGVFLISANPDCDYNNWDNTVTWSGISLEPGESQTFIIEVYVQSSGRLTNTVSATAPGEGGPIGSDSVTVWAEEPYIPPYTPPYIPPVSPVEPSKPVLNTEDHVAYIVGDNNGLSRPLANISRAEVATIFFRLLTDESRAYYWCQTNPYPDVNENDWFNNAISTLTNAGILGGLPDGTFGPHLSITRAEFAAIAARFSDVVYDGECPFPDVAKTHWAYNYIGLAYELGWIGGDPDGSFRPNDPILRAEAITLINRVLERDVEEEHMLPDMVQWPDNQPGTWYYAAVQEATNSHKYTRLTKPVPNQDFCYENWVEILKVPDWAALEKIWSTANSK